MQHVGSDLQCKPIANQIFFWYNKIIRIMREGGMVNSMLRIAVCDDVKTFLDQIKKAILGWMNCLDNIQVETFEDADSLIFAHSSRPFDIIFLDVIMPMLNGIEAASEIRQTDKSVKIVFLTSSPEFAVDSYSVKANNYLLKPIDTEKLYTCLQELYEELQKNAKTIVVKSARALHHVVVKDIEYLEAQNKYVAVVLSDGTSIISVKPMYSYQDILSLDDGFFKCNRSYIVNINRIETYKSNEIYMKSGCRISVSRSCYKEFEAAYFEVIFGKGGDR